MPLYEVRVEGIAVEYYLVKAKSEEEARDTWADGDLLSQEGHSYGVEEVQLAFDQEDDDAEEEDPYEDDPLQHGVYDD